MDKFRYYTSGTCSQAIEIEIDGDCIANVTFFGGCQGNLRGISSLVKGMKVTDVIDRLEGIQCGSKGTSCPDQFAKALKEYLAKK